MRKPEEREISSIKLHIVGKHTDTEPAWEWWRRRYARASETLSESASNKAVDGNSVLTMLSKRPSARSDRRVGIAVRQVGHSLFARRRDLLMQSSQNRCMHWELIGLQGIARGKKRKEKRRHQQGTTQKIIFA
jgi:hypothetical protein